ncbi:hypothetical protein [Mesorhizobium escarrei]|uniref:Uncharacterized protein n=1 Tax=Mesorhizobium escarrei TaxID=666018 RepID=A0ABM9ECP6_9HYPH|nr:hypothetical protein [Mesorhizobium escarrei]CAH2407074.1 hypothetical protein MES5069_550125 [Mesorhizobium escarrei]
MSSGFFQTHGPRLAELGYDLVPIKIGPVSVCSGICKHASGRFSDSEIGEAWAQSLKWPGLQITERVYHDE